VSERRPLSMAGISPGCIAGSIRNPRKVSRKTTLCSFIFLEQLHPFTRVEREQSLCKATPQEAGGGHVTD